MHTIEPLLLAALLLGPAPPPAPSPPVRDLDLAFLLDTTGSMSGEIREVKERVGEIASALTAARPGARLRIGVVAYRDRGDAYLTQVSPLAEDIEQSLRFLAALGADGGGDGPEDVLAGIAAALHELAWDETDAADREAFLIGDAPPHLDYADSPRAIDLFAEARTRRIVVNAIGCRSLPAAGVAFFRAAAYATEGAYHHIGRVDLASGTGRAPALADAMLHTLAPSAPADAGVPVAATPIDRGPGDGHLLSAEALAADSDGRCRLSLSLPEGLRLGRDPLLRLAGDGLHVHLALASGQGERLLLELEECLPPITPVHIDLED